MKELKIKPVLWRDETQVSSYKVVDENSNTRHWGTYWECRDYVQVSKFFK